MNKALLALALLFAAAAACARDVAPQRECSVCHIAWLSEFNREGATPLTPHTPKVAAASGVQDVASAERMCFSCHDGFVLDSRAAWTGRGHSHPVGVAPSNKVKIPTRDGKRLFPLNDDGKVYCGTCHSAHGTDWEGKTASTLFMRVPNVDSGLCIACHLERSTGTAEGNHPIFKAMKEMPAALGAAGGRLGGGREVICESCHRVHNGAERKLLIVRNDASELCGTCHADRYARDAADAGRKGTHPVNVKPNRASVADSVLGAGGRLGPGGTLICQTCHKPHFATPSARLLAQPNPRSELCQSCHAEQRSVASTKHNLAALGKPAQNTRGQDVAQAGVCAGCHVPHGGAGPKMAAQKGGVAADGISSLCLSCHRENGLAQEKLVGAHSHPVSRDLARLPNPVDFPGFTLDGVKAQGKGLLTCASCHDPHKGEARSARPAEAEATAQPSGNAKFLRKPNDAASSLCRACHREKESVAGTKHDVAAIGQASGAAGLCANCHLPHNGRGPRMWAREMKAGADPVSSTCLSCHDAKGLAKDKLIGAISHPVGVPIERAGIVAHDREWRRTDNLGPPPKPLPLYDATGAPAQEGGNVTCGACHDPHRWSADPNADAGKPPKEVKGSARTSFLRLPADRDEALCANCHGNKTPVTRSKHNLALSAPDAVNASGKDAVASGTCGVCHQPHNAKAAKLWAREIGTGGDEIEKRCTACHLDGGVAGKKLTGNSHPMGIDLKRTGSKTTLPLYTADGKRDAENGKLTCATCHDLHQWKPREPASAAGAHAKVEGNASDSFLRLPAGPEPELCADCHRDKHWVRNTEHDMRVTAPGAKNALGQAVAESGVCSQCHTPHNATSKFRLWALDIGPGGDVQEQLCRSCHWTGRVAEKKQPLKAQHPSKVTALSPPSRVRLRQASAVAFPVYDAHGNRDSVGKITCPTCHDPHKWSALEDKAGDGRNVEGDVRNSFLRNVSDYGLCADCHGLDALFRYKYFHGEQSRKQHRLFR